MNTIEAITARRSIRRFKETPLPEEAVQTIIKAASLAPSGKNRQPWKFIVVQGEKCADMVRLMREGIDRNKAKGDQVGSAEWTTMSMEHAPVTIFIYNPSGLRPWLAHSIDQNFQELVDVQSIGAAIQNMLLAAEDLGIGSLWICDVFSAYEELSNWLGETGELIAAVSFGYADESPAARPRKPLDEVVRWL